MTFTAPAAGSYTVTGDFLGIDTGERLHGVEVLVNGLPSFISTISSYAQNDPFSISTTLGAGGTISFIVLGGSLDNCGYCNLSTGLQAQIDTPLLTSATPLPSTWTMLVAGFVGLCFFAYRGLKKGDAGFAAT